MISLVHPVRSTLLILGGSSALLSAATPVPDWFGGPFSTRYGWTFDSDDLTPAPAIADNAHGSPASTVTLTEFADGWQDPGSSIPELTGVTMDGAWDLGMSGDIAIDLQFAASPPAPGTHYRVDLQVYVIAYQGLIALPSLDVVGLPSEELALEQSTLAPDPVFPFFSWEGMAWTGTYDNLATNDLSIRVSAPADNTSVVDAIEVSTTYTVVPEPSSLLLTATGLFIGLSRRQRS